MPVDLRLVQHLRNRILGEMHLGHLVTGQRLPNIRDLSWELGADHRAIAAALRTLEEEGLVQIRGRTGVYVADQERLGGELAEETAVWLASVLSEARRRRIGIPDFPDFVRACTARTRLRCVCVESNVDSSTALRVELEEEFGLETISVEADQIPTGWRRDSRVSLPAELEGADLVVTTAFHAATVRPVAEELHKPFAMLTVDPAMVRIIERRVEGGRLTVIVADELYGDRFRSIYGKENASAIRVVLAEDRRAIAWLDRSDPVIATRAARRMLPDLDLPLLVPRYPLISPESTKELAQHLIRLNVVAPAVESAP